MIAAPAAAGPALRLNNGVVMPAVGLGVYQAGAGETFAAVNDAIAAGYRLIDTASGYGNEADVGRAVRESGVDRAALFVTTKLKPVSYDPDAARRAFDRSMANLGLDLLDLYLLHWPVPARFQRTLAAWEACRTLLADGRVRAIGVCNFAPVHLDRLVERSGFVPAVNQIEQHPFFMQADHDAAHRRLGIVSQAWSPIGGIDRYRQAEHGGRDPLLERAVLDVAARHGRTPAQIILRWHLQLGHAVIPKSVRPERIRENIALFDFALAPDEMALLSALDTGVRGGPDPETLYSDLP